MRISSIVCGMVLNAAAFTPAVAQRAGAPAPVNDPAASIDIVVKPVRNGSPDVQYAEIHEQIVRSAGATSADFGVLVPGGPPGPPAPAGLEILEMADTHGAVPVRADSGNSRR